jgi:hypothetical protein
MKDRIPRYPGRVKATPVEGEENLFDIERMDDPYQTGMPLNKQNMLKDRTAERLGGNAEMNIDDAINVLIDESKFVIGDILQTVRTLPDNWILADGQVVDEEEYPELYETLPFTGSVQSQDFTVVTRSKDTYTANAKIIKADGYYACMCRSCFCYRPVNSNSWSVRDFSSVFLTRQGTTGTSNYRVEYTDLLWDDVNEQWLIAAKSNTTESGTTSQIMLFKLATVSSSLSLLFYDSGFYNGAISLYKDGGYFFLFNDQSNTYNDQHKRWVTTDPNGTWSSDSSFGAFGMSYTPHYIFKAGNRWIACGCLNDATNSVNRAAIAISAEGQDLFSTSPAWTVKTMGDAKPNGNDYSVNKVFVQYGAYLENSGCYVFWTNAETGSYDHTFYSYDLDTFALHTTNVLAQSYEYQRPVYTNGVLYCKNGNLLDVAQNSGVPIVLDTLVYGSGLLEEGAFVEVDGTNTNKYWFKVCVKSVPDLTAENDTIFKIKANGAPFSGGGDVPEPEWIDLEFTDPDSDGNIVVTMSGY